MSRAIISVYDKRYIESFAGELTDMGYEILSTGGTLQKLRDSGIEAADVEDVTGFSEILDGRVKTLHPLLHGGILADREKDEHKHQLNNRNIKPIDLVVVNFYPFSQTVRRPDVSDEEIMENIDIGGPAMLRAAAKNSRYVTPVVDPDDYDRIIQALKMDYLDQDMRKQLAAKVFRHTAQYDAIIADYLTEEAFPEQYTVTYEKAQSLRYGENPHQEAAYYKNPLAKDIGLASSKQLHGKQLSYNNIQDADAALRMLGEYQEPVAVAVKHTNPSGIGLGDSLREAFLKAYEADPVSIFGGLVAVNRTVDEAIARHMQEIFLEVVLAPHFTEEAFALLTNKKNIRLLEFNNNVHDISSHELTSIHGGVLIQTDNNGSLSEADLVYPTAKRPEDGEMTDLFFAWKAVKHVKSNAIVLAKNGQTIGVGAGQMNRISAAEKAIEQAGADVQGAVLASDAFFPMPDTVEAAAKAGITAIIQPGGSKRDQASIDMCEDYGIAMVMTGIRHFKH